MSDSAQHLPKDQHLPKEMLHAAMNWQVVLWSGEVTADEQRKFQDWLQAHPLHHPAWQQVQNLDRHLSGVSSQIAGSVLHKTTTTDLRRRRMLLSMGALSALGILGYGTSLIPQWRIAHADYRTARGEIRTLQLPDGTELILNTASAVNIQFTSSERRIILVRGEILVTTGTDLNAGSRPLFVDTQAGIVRPIGTRFRVRQRDDAAQNIDVQVEEGTVELLPKQGQGIHLHKGQQAQFNAQQVAYPEPANATDMAWTRGLLIAEQQRLADFIADLNRYHSGVLRCDPAAADLIVSGVYPLKDTHAILHALEKILPVEVDTWLGYWTRINRIAPQ